MNPQISRRRFLKTSSTVAAAGALLGNRANALSSKTAIVIGSGWGGSVTALRLGQAGIRTTVIERGRSWAYQGTNTFPLMFDGSSDGRTTWLGTTNALLGTGAVPRYAGMIERITGDTLDAVCGAGVGGGSLVYGGVLLQPKREVFTKVFPTINYDQMASVYYPRVLARVSGGSIPDDILARPEYRAAAEALGVFTRAGFEVVKANVGFNWNTIRQELSGALPKFASISEYVYGCNSGAKNTLDKNYLASATATGNVTIQPLRIVKRVRSRSDGLYDVTGDAIDVNGNVTGQFTLTANYVFMAAGSLNTSKLMVKAKASGDLPALNQWVGKNWGTNGDELLMRIALTDISGAQGGPPAIAAFDMRNTIRPVAFMQSPGAVGAVNLQLQLAMTIPDQLGQITYDAASDAAGIQWPSLSQLTSE
ncbi:MAG TPA: GMC family oxidoreductase N-terminal domain-containing protein, partial [Spongiibacteraceae bacterium]